MQYSAVTVDRDTAGMTQEPSGVEGSLCGEIVSMAPDAIVAIGFLSSHDATVVAREFPAVHFTVIGIKPVEPNMSARLTLGSDEGVPELAWSKWLNARLR